MTRTYKDSTLTTIPKKEGLRNSQKISGSIAPPFNFVLNLATDISLTSPHYYDYSTSIAGKYNEPILQERTRY